MGKMILVVESDEEAAAKIGKTLHDLGYAYLLTPTGKEALIHAKNGSYDAALVDIDLPGSWSSKKIGSALRSRYGIPVIFLTHVTNPLSEPALLIPGKKKQLHSAIEGAIEMHTNETMADCKGPDVRHVSLFEGSLVGALVHDLEGQLLDATQATLDLLGYTREEIPFLTFSALVDQEHLPRASTLIEEIKKTGYKSAPAEFRLKRKNGDNIWVELEAFPVFQQETLHAIQSVVRDITGRKRSETQLKSLFEAAKKINSTMDMEKRFGYISESVRDLVGADHVIIFFLSQDRSLVYPVYSSPDLKENVEVMALLYNQQILNRCIDTRESVLFHSPDDSPFAKEGTLSEILLPLVVEDQCVGAAYLAQRTPEYTQHDVDILKPLSEVISAAIWNSRLYEEVQTLNRDLEKKIADKAHRIETILNAKQVLQRETSWERGLITMVDSIRELGFDRCGIFMVDPMRKRLKFYYGTGTDVPLQSMVLSLTRTEYFGVQCVLEKRTVYVKDAFTAQGKQVTSDASSFVWIPIIVRDEAFAAIAADNPKTRRMVSEEDVKDLELLAGMCAAFVDRTRLLVEPAAENKDSTDLRHNLEPGEGYIIAEKKPEKSFEIFVDMVTHEIPGFIVSRAHPERIKRKYNFVKTPMVWLTRSQVEHGVDPNDLSKLIFIIRNFTRRSEQSVVLLDGLEYLMTQNGFEAVLRFLRDLKDTVVLNNSRLIIPLHTDTLSERELGLLERELIVMK